LTLFSEEKEKSIKCKTHKSKKGPTLSTQEHGSSNTRNIGTKGATFSPYCCTGSSLRCKQITYKLLRNFFSVAEHSHISHRAVVPTRASITR
jgi:hypothetical protein